VVQVTVTEVCETPVVATLEITGGVDACAVVVNAELLEVVDTALEFAETTSKSYVVPGVSPVSVTEWLVTRVEFRVEADPYPVVVP
jgi:hypothetical protein